MLVPTQVCAETGGGVRSREDRVGLGRKAFVLVVNHNKHTQGPANVPIHFVGDNSLPQCACRSVSDPPPGGPLVSAPESRCQAAGGKPALPSRCVLL